MKTIITAITFAIALISTTAFADVCADSWAPDIARGTSKVNVEIGIKKCRAYFDESFIKVGDTTKGDILRHWPKANRTTKTTTANGTVDFLHYDGLVIMFVNDKVISFQQ